MIARTGAGGTGQHKSACVLLALCMAFVLSGCANTQRVDANEFMAAAGEIGLLRSARHTEFVGATPTRVYLERWRATSFGGDGATVLWIPRNELPAEFVEKLMAARSRTGAK